MALEWTGWLEPPNNGKDHPGSPYVNWWSARQPMSASSALAGGDKLVLPLDDAQARIKAREPQQFIQSGTTRDTKPKAGESFQASPSRGYQSEFPIIDVPLRKKALNKDLWDIVAENPDGDTNLQKAPDFSDVPRLSRDSVIVGIIDRGIPLNHTRLLGATGTRILASWQMDADWDNASQAYLPFGQEVYNHDINAALSGNPTDDDFNNALGLIDLQSLNRSRDLAYRQSHGAAVLDLAAGAMPDVAPENIWVIAVNLPSRETIGLSGAYLDFFTTLASERINLLANWLWSHTAATDDVTAARKGFPIVTNLSFGKNAGPQRSDDFFHHSIGRIRAGRPAGAPFIPVIPVGNDNLEEGHAKQLIPAFGAQNPQGSTIYQGWWVQPEDQSSSFLEVWSEPIEEKYLPGGANLPFTFSVFLPGQEPVAAVPTIPKVDTFRVLTPQGVAPDMTGELLGEAPFAAVFVRRFPEPGVPGFFRMQFTICVLPTLDQLQPSTVVPSGEWVVQIENKTDRPVQFDFMVQTDQSGSRTARTSQRSWLTDLRYSRYDETERSADSYVYPCLSAGSHDTAQVQRHGTMNSTSVGDGFLAVAGHRELDGRPAGYSSTGQRNGMNEHVPDISCPVEDGAAHAGILSAGARDGTCLPIGGTSMAAAIATQKLSHQLAEMLANGASPQDLQRFDPEQWFRLLAQRDDPYDVSSYGRPKLGWGRVRHTDPRNRIQHTTDHRSGWLDPQNAC